MYFLLNIKGFIGRCSLVEFLIFSVICLNPLFSDNFVASGKLSYKYQKLKWKMLCDGFSGCEGAKWIESDGNLSILFAAHHDNLVFKWSKERGLSLWKSHSPEATSFRPDGRGGYYVVEQGTRRLTRWNKDGDVVEILSDSFNGKKLNRPNDARVDHLGRVWFTDPNYLFKKRPHETQELPGQYVLCYDPIRKTLIAPIKNFKSPNGIAIDHLEKELYIGDSSSSSIYKYKIKPDGSLVELGLFYKLKRRGLDGLSIDTENNLWFAGMSEISQLDKQANIVLSIQMPNKPTSMDFHKSGWLCVTLRDSAYVTKLK